MAKSKQPKTKPIANKPIAAAAIEIPPLRDALAVDTWHEIVGILTANGIITPRDRSVVAMYCDSYSQYVEARNEVARSGAISTTDKGNQILSPWAILLGRAHKECLRLLRELGLTPAARAKVKSIDGQGTSKFAAIFG